MTNSNLSGILITGGLSKRMGTDKATMLNNDIMLAERMNNIIKHHCNIIIVASNHPDHAQFGNILVPDSLGEGPLAGLYSGLKSSENDLNLVLPTDTPLLTHRILDELIENIDDYDAIVAVDRNEKVHPLIGVYHKRILPMLEKQLLEGKYAVMRLLDSINTLYLNFDEVKAFTNINTKEEL